MAYQVKRASSQGSNDWTIGELSRRSGVAASAIRYYERLGLMPQPPRRHNWRRYDGQALERLRIIGAARAGGLRVSEIRILTAAWSAGPVGRQTVLREHLEKIKTQRAQLGRQIETIEAAMACACTGPESCDLRATTRGRERPLP
jgi:DNA-binding transcriptional MerR regulator